MSGRHTQFMRQFFQRAQCEPVMPRLSCHLQPAGEVAAMRQCQRGIVRRAHHCAHAARLQGLAVCGLGHQRIPGAEQRLVRFERAVTEQQADQITFGFCLRADPFSDVEMIMQYDFVASLQFFRFAPCRFPAMSSTFRNCQYRMIRRQSQRMAFTSTQPEHGFRASGKKSG